MTDLSIKGVMKTSMLDYPDKLSAVLFVSHCNFRCPFCHNPELVLEPNKLDDIPKDEILSFLKERKRWIDGVVITGGEPTLHKGINDFIRRIKELGLLVKLDTNGTNPEILEKLIAEKLVDYIAMDIKSSPERYHDVVGVKPNMNAIKRSVEAIRNSKVDYEFRATVVPHLFDEDEARKIGEWLRGSKKFCLQQFRNSDKVLDSKFQDREPFKPDELKRFAEIMKPYFKDVEVRGI